MRLWTLGCLVVLLPAFVHGEVCGDEWGRRVEIANGPEV
jgi:hypothetical protein